MILRPFILGTPKLGHNLGSYPQGFRSLGLRVCEEEWGPKGLSYKYSWAQVRYRFLDPLDFLVQTNAFSRRYKLNYERHLVYERASPKELDPTPCRMQTLLPLA